MRENRTSGLMSGDGRRGFATAPILDSTRIAAIRWRVSRKALIAFTELGVEAIQLT